jgi:hypothetical protein
MAGSMIAINALYLKAVNTPSDHVAVTAYYCEKGRRYTWDRVQQKTTADRYEIKGVRARLGNSARQHLAFLLDSYAC